MPGSGPYSAEGIKPLFVQSGLGLFDNCVNVPFGSDLTKLQKIVCLSGVPQRGGIAGVGKNAERRRRKQTNVGMRSGEMLGVHKMYFLRLQGNARTA